MSEEPNKPDDIEVDLAEELEYIAAHQKMFSKAEMGVVMKEAAAELRDLRNLLGMHAAVELANTKPEGSA